MDNARYILDKVDGVKRTNVSLIEVPEEGGD